MHHRDPKFSATFDDELRSWPASSEVGNLFPQHRRLRFIQTLGQECLVHFMCSVSGT
jgi:hypothetical protein